MKFLYEHRRKIGAALTAAVLSLAGASAWAGTAGADVNPVPATTNPVTLSASPTDGLVNGQAVTFTVNTSGSTKLQGALTAHLCIHGLTGYGTSNFGYSGNTAVRCVYSTGIVAGTGLTGSDYEQNYPAYDGTQSTSGPLTFHVGTGTVTWGNSTGQGPNTLTADVNDPADLVIQVNLTGDSVPTTYFVQPLTFAGQPDPPTGVAATPHDASAHVTWTAPVNTGNGTINHYIVTATQTGGAPDASSPRTFDAGTATAADIPLANFSVYSVTVHDTIASAGVPASAESTPVANVSPLPPPPTNVVGTPAAGQVNVSWTAPASLQGGLTQYEVTATGGPTPVVQLTGSTATAFAFTGLDNGTPYTFSVRAEYGPGEFGPSSNGSGAIVPSNKEIDQLVQVDRPQGALVLTQTCDASTPNPYPVDANGVPNPTYPTSPAVAGTPGALGSCSIDLGHASFITDGGVPGPGYPNVGEGQFFKADGALHQVTVVDTRDGDVGWNVNGVLESDFTSGAAHFSAQELGWVPAVTDHSPGFSTPDLPGGYANDAAPGATVLPASHAADHGLGSAQTLAAATAGGGLGIARLDAQLHLLIPVFAQHGVYTAVLQITAI